MDCSLATSQPVPSDTESPSFHAVIDSNVFTFVRKPKTFPLVPSKTENLDPSPRISKMPNFYAPGWATSFLPFLAFRTLIAHRWR
ncbi:hypothetical protein GG344DRAFT_84689 [Lentinula edodes]|nr:hypothetical protein GG344DRAFT_84689 [Lentinula edodes]